MMFELKLFVGVGLDSTLESKKRLFPLFQLEEIEYEKQNFLGKTVEVPLELHELKNFEKHVASLIKRIHPTHQGTIFIFPK